MILQRLRVDSFRALEALEVRFGPGLNVVRGPNEAGKSTLQAAIVTVLFADPHSRTKATEAMKPWGLDTFPALSAEIASRARNTGHPRTSRARPRRRCWLRRQTADRPRRRRVDNGRLTRSVTRPRTAPPPVWSSNSGRRSARARVQELVQQY